MMKESPAQHVTSRMLTLRRYLTAGVVVSLLILIAVGVAVVRHALAPPPATTQVATTTSEISATSTTGVPPAAVDPPASRTPRTPTPVPVPVATPPAVPAAPALPAGNLSSAGTRAVTTFSSIGLYWSPGADLGSAGCAVQYRKSSENVWHQGLPLWYDDRNGECRGSLVQLSPGTRYIVQLGLPGQAFSRELGATTWSETFPIAQTIAVSDSSETLDIASGGTPEGYILYTGPATIDVANAEDYAVRISAPYVIIRGLTLRGARQHGINISPTAHDIVIEDNDISGWGRFRESSDEGDLGRDRDSGIRARCSDSALTRVTIQRNKIHDPRYTANTWALGHPEGPQGIDFGSCAGGNFVFRYNEIYGGTSGNYFNDGMGGGENFSTVGFPGPDSDIYGNIVKNAWDDGIEVEGGGRNVRVWNNYLDRTATGVASTWVATGPLYIFRNVYNRSQLYADRPLDSGGRECFAKAGGDAGRADGRRYLFHNTLLQATGAGASRGLGAACGVTSVNRTLLNTVSRNNIYHLWRRTSAVAIGTIGADNDFDYDLYNGVTGRISEENGIHGTPAYAPGNGWTSEAGGLYQLDAASPGYDAGVRIPNFNDAFIGAGPDIGAAEAGAGAMRLGVSARD